MHDAVVWGRIGAVALLLEAGADPHAPDDRGVTPIDLARRGVLWSERKSTRPPPCGNCRDDVLALLLAPSPAPPPCGSLCKTEFWEAADSERVRSALAQAPANTRWSAPGGGPLHLALAAGADLEVVRLLLDYGMALNGRDLGGRYAAPCSGASVRRCGGAGALARASRYGLCHQFEGLDAAACGIRTRGNS